MSKRVDKIYKVEVIGEGIKICGKCYFKKYDDAVENFYLRAEEHGNGEVELAAKDDLVRKDVILAGTTVNRDEIEESELIELSIIEVSVY